MGVVAAAHAVMLPEMGTRGRPGRFSAGPAIAMRSIGYWRRRLAGEARFS